MRTLPSKLRLIALLFAGLALTGCRSFTEHASPGEDEGMRPAPATFLHGGAGTNDLELSTNGWWEVFNDPVLNGLVERLDAANPDLEAALARMDQSFAMLGITRGPLLPTVTASFLANRTLDSVNNLLFPIDSRQYSRYRIGASASWELDLWGRVRGTVSRDRFLAEAEELTFHDARLSLRANLVRQYFSLRSAETELAILRDAIGLREANLELQESRLELGVGVEVDAARARVELANATADLEASVRSLGKQQNALAVLVGLAPAEFELAIREGEAAAGRVPVVPEGVPSTLLARRPDLRAADRTLRAAAIQVGVRKSDFLPKITLNGAAGLASLKASSLFEGASGFYDIGPQIDLPIFQAGTRKSAVAQAQAEWREAVAVYRGALLTAVREVDDALLDLKSLERESVSRLAGVEAATTAAVAARDRHDAGLASYFEFIDADRGRLQARLAENILRREQWAASVSLIQALGGGW